MFSPTNIRFETVYNLYVQFIEINDSRNYIQQLSISLCYKQLTIQLTYVYIRYLNVYPLLNTAKYRTIPVVDVIKLFLEEI